MQMLNKVVLSFVIFASLPAAAGWRSANPTAAEAVKNPKIAAVLERAMVMDKALLAHDVASFSDILTEDAVVNNPFNKIARKSDALKNLETKLIDYTSLERSIEYAAIRGENDVVLMGEESLTPIGNAKYAGTHLRRRTTEIWTNEKGVWRLAIRQATIFSVEEIKK